MSGNYRVKRHTKRPKRTTACEGKRKLVSRQAAEDYKHRVLVQKLGAVAGQLRPYRCRYCWLVRDDGTQIRPWHVGHSTAYRS